MVLKLAFSLALLTAVGVGTTYAQTTTPEVRSPTLGDPGAKPAPVPRHRPRFKPVPKPQPSSGNGSAPDRAAAGGGGR